MTEFFHFKKALLLTDQDPPVGVDEMI